MRARSAVCTKATLSSAAAGWGKLRPRETASVGGPADGVVDGDSRNKAFNKDSLSCLNHHTEKKDSRIVRCDNAQTAICGIICPHGVAA